MLPGAYTHPGRTAQSQHSNVYKHQSLKFVPLKTLNRTCDQLHLQALWQKY